jgi:hypothetical protein
MSFLTIRIRINTQQALGAQDLNPSAGVSGFSDNFPSGSFPHSVGARPRQDELGDQNVASTQHHRKGNEANDNAPKYAGALLLNCCLKHSDCSSSYRTKMVAILFADNL